MPVLTLQSGEPLAYRLVAARGREEPDEENWSLCAGLVHTLTRTVSKMVHARKKAEMCVPAPADPGIAGRLLQLLDEGRLDMDEEVVDLGSVGT